MSLFPPLPLRPHDKLPQLAYQVRKGRATEPNGDSKINGDSPFAAEHAAHAAHWDQEVDRISLYPRFQGLQDYLAVLSASIVTAFVTTPAKPVVCDGFIEAPTETKLQIGLSLCAPETIASIAFDIWKVNRRSFQRLLKLEDLSSPPPWVQSIPCTPDREAQKSACFVIEDKDLLNPNFLWISPARLTGTYLDGSEFSYNFVTSMAESAKENRIEIPRNRLFTPRRAAPM